MTLVAIHSGGQTGADQGGLAAAVSLGLKTGGWMPRGWRTELGSEPWLAELGLREHSSSKYPPRTSLNVEETDGTLIFGNPESRGSKLTKRLARADQKPVFILHWSAGDPVPSDEPVWAFQRWLSEHDIAVLNVAGNRESRQPGIRDAVRKFLVSALS